MKKALLALTLLAGTAASPFALAQSAYPTKPIRWVVPYPAGGGSDFMARTAAAQMTIELGQNILVDNKPGGNGAIAVQDILRGGPDGYAVMNADNGHMVFNPVLYKSLTYKVSDLTPVSLIGRVPMMLITTPGSEFKSAKEVLAKAKANPGKYSVASAGSGSPHHLALELLKQTAGLHLVHIPYRGAAPSLADVAGGQVPLAISDFAAAAGFIKGGKVTPLAVFTAKRVPQLPDVPTFAELGLKDMEAYALVGLVAPTGTPADVIAKLQQATAKAMHNPTVSKKFVDFGVEPVGSTTAEYTSLLQSETTRWHKLIRDLKIQLD
ncbi:Bug family tripartite tricarboxylate transporter substrate binding protein [Ottowia sp. VDI28]|uniref:Bug family tripartite tricarboxylate transporter substrate binding protein n=1 Tax=Ottowia sp. VDI28 TaxID=3133968 RepID=UPI003C2C2F2E